MNETKICGQSCGCTSPDQCDLSLKPAIIPAWITEAEKKIKAAQEDPDCIGVFIIRNRRTGMRFLHNLVTNTEDVALVSKQLIPEQTKADNL